MVAGRPLKFNSVEELDEKIADYFETQDQRARANSWSLPLYNMYSLAVHLDCDPKTLHNYKQKEEYFPSIKRALDKCEAVLTDKMQLGDGSVTGAIFISKNCFDWKDKSEVDSTITDKRIVVKDEGDKDALEALDNKE